jgi:hypothetical protein
MLCISSPPPHPMHSIYYMLLLLFSYGKSENAIRPPLPALPQEAIQLYCYTPQNFFFPGGKTSVTVKQEAQYKRAYSLSLTKNFP